ncbi:hypothetical protein ACRE_037780 [Hapsidospora chrysogenum ATCC 11550]|uniref:Aminoglycoside phosphotransferase domain-containing protein n=1 Tax=Hapsidospora chrysogenum (strain ATCC 11550 / CBS 779.69 / DSM 880 / IAM 14645 / JCM 23072 / IMI 49137) TaxID=857340 RepID=A0A086T7S8_HAPC1|nr:hypothetical protein ACRE_037780 [Hapsidospora chrysogenum ATCC 11550]
MTAYDEVAQANADDECRAWIRRLIAARDDVVAFVDARLDGKGTGKYLGFFKGSFNLSFHIGFGGQRPGVLIRFAKPGHTHTPWRAEKVTNEVRTIQFLHQHTTIPVPCIRCWGLAEESPHQLGPFIIMDFIDGARLSTFLKQPSEDEDADLILNPNIDEEIPDTIYNQLADYVLQLSRLDFSQIGAISQDGSKNWAVTSRPLTYDMNELVTSTGYPTNQLPTAQFHSASDYFQSISNQRLLHLKTQRNLAKDEADVRRRFIARHRFKQLIPEYCIDDAGPFKFFCDDMQPANMLIDPSTLRITAILDFEFTNSMPAQFTYDPPWWLLLRGPDVWLDGNSMDEFLARYVPRMEQFLRALERVEETSAAGGHKELGTEPRLSTRMRDSWKTGRFWFNYAARTCLDMGDIYWHTLQDQVRGEGVDSLDEAARAELESLVLKKMEQLEAYEKEWAVRFGDD